MTNGLQGRKIRVLVVDDSALVRGVLRRGLASDPQIDVIDAVSDPYAARDVLVRERPDVMTLDVEMPKMDGISFLRKVMRHMPTPTIVVSSLTTSGSRVALQALEAGAVDVVAKPAAGVGEGLRDQMSQIAERVKVAACSRVVRHEPPAVAPMEEARPERIRLETTDAVIGLGASTGGVAALTRMLPTFPAWSPGIVIVQHMPAGFTGKFAERLAEMCALRVKEARHGDRVLPGHALVAPGGDRHLEVRRVGGEYRVHLRQGDPESGHTPSVDVFFSSLAREVGPRAAGCLLTGMGRDGAQGLLALKISGGHTFAQDKESSAVWGMPAAACELGAVESCLPLEKLGGALLDALAPRSK